MGRVIYVNHKMNPSPSNRKDTIYDTSFATLERYSKRSQHLGSGRRTPQRGTPALPRGNERILVHVGVYNSTGLRLCEKRPANSHVGWKLVFYRRLGEKLQLWKNTAEKDLLRRSRTTRRANGRNILAPGALYEEQGFALESAGKLVCFDIQKAITYRTAVRSFEFDPLG